MLAHAASHKVSGLGRAEIRILVWVLPLAPFPAQYCLLVQVDPVQNHRITEW